MPNTQKIEEWEKIVNDVFKKDDAVILISTRNEKEYLHLEMPERIVSSIDNNGVVNHTILPPRYSVSKTMSEGAIDEREISIVEKIYKQSDVIKELIKNLISQAQSATRKEIREEIEKTNEYELLFAPNTTEHEIKIMNSAYKKGQKEAKEEILSLPSLKVEEETKL